MTSRQVQRVVVCFALVGLGVWLFTRTNYVFGPHPAPNQPMVGIPAPWVGMFFMGAAGLGLCGVNIFKGGPFDPAKDPPAQDE